MTSTEAKPSTAKPQSDPRPTQQEILVRSTLALRYARRGAITQAQVDAIGELLTHYAEQVW